MYETEDTFTRHLPEEYMHMAVAPIKRPDGREVVLAGDRVLVSLEPEFGQAYIPGSLKEMLAKMSTGAPAETYMFEPMRHEYQNRAARIAEMDKQGVTSTIMYPGGWGLMTEEYVDDTEAMYANLHSLNLYMEEEWGYGDDERIYAPATLSLKNLDLAVEELKFVLGRGARFIMLTTGPAYGRSPSDPYFDPFWSLVNEANASICYHITELYYNKLLAPVWGHDPHPAHFRMSAWQWMNTYGDRPIIETLSALIFDNLFGRFPNIKVLASEFGASWLPHFLWHMDKSRGMGRNGPWLGGQLDRRPSQIFRDHVRVVPYPEDDPVKLVNEIGFHESIAMGSDWPHAEGLAEPADYRKLLTGLTEQQQDDIMYNTGAALVSR
ncbi:amidohydrolase family protein [Rhodococcus koreensis]|uniref:amidohydrolase family protein n=1 Tax=Rhodococcus koreensis TaxID=99653 RepID=UPI00366DB50E